MGKWLNGARVRKREIDGKDTRIAALAAAEAQIQAAMADIEKAKNDLSDVQIIKNILGLEGNG